MKGTAKENVTWKGKGKEEGAKKRENRQGGRKKRREESEVGNAEGKVRGYKEL